MRVTDLVCEDFTGLPQAVSPAGRSMPGDRDLPHAGMFAPLGLGAGAPPLLQHPLTQRTRWVSPWATLHSPPPSIEDLPDDTALPLDAWTAKVEAFMAEWEAQQDGSA